MDNNDSMEVFDDVTANTQQDDDLVVGGLDKLEMQQFYKYLMGQTLEAPEVLNKMMSNLISKISMSLGYTVVNNIARQSDLAKFMAEAEKTLFNSERIATMSDKELRDAYKEAKNTLTGLQEFSRKFVVQNRDSLRVEDSKQEKLMNKLLALPPEKLEAVTKIIEEADKEKQAATDPSVITDELDSSLDTADMDTEEDI